VLFNQELKAKTEWTFVPKNGDIVRFDHVHSELTGECVVKRVVHVVHQPELGGSEFWTEIHVLPR